MKPFSRLTFVIGPFETRRLIGCMCKDREIFSRAILIVQYFDHPVLLDDEVAKNMPCTYNTLIVIRLNHRRCSLLIPDSNAGGSSGEETPVPIPNTAVKLTSSDGTWTQPGPGRVARCRTIKDTPLNGCVFVCVEPRNGSSRSSIACIR